MPGTRPLTRLPSSLLVARMIADTREVTARTVALLQSQPAPDTFAGRKTQEPFPQEDDLSLLAPEN